MSEKIDKKYIEQAKNLSDGCEMVYSADELASRLQRCDAEGRPMRIKLGLDPTAPDIHLGHTVVLKKIRQFQELGHRAVIIIGDYTARIGDPTGTNKTRPILSPEQIDLNAKTYLDQAAKVLDTNPEKLEIRRNSEWLKDMTTADILHLASHITVAQMMERDTFKKRFASEVPIGIHEFFYPLMQGYDSVIVRADVELGGNDQTFNNLIGRDIQRAYSQTPQIVMILPILVGLDGVEKMSKSKGNYIGVTDEPNDMFGKIMSISDKMMPEYFSLLTETPADEIKVLTDSEQTHPKQAKTRLGKIIVERYHDAASADAAEAQFNQVFAKHKNPDDMPAIPVKPQGQLLVDVMVAASFAKSKTDAKKLIKQNAVTVDDEKITDIHAVVHPGEGDGANEKVLKVGKRRFARIVFGEQS